MIFDETGAEDVTLKDHTSLEMRKNFCRYFALLLTEIVSTISFWFMVHAA